MNKYILLYLGSLCMGTSLYAQENKQTQAQKDSLQQLNEITVSGTKQKFRREKSTTVSKMPLADIENPQVYNSISSELLKEQVVTNFNDALKNATGVTRLWESTGRGGDGAEYYSMRGFSVQPTMINGLPAINNGTIDPANVDNIEVIKGPSGTLFGSSVISYGGLINIVTKKPTQNFGGEISYNRGSYDANRVTADINAPLNSKKSVLFRLITAYQNQDSFQDAGFNKSFFVAPSLSYAVNDRLSFLVNADFTSRKAANAPMLFINRYVPVSFTSIDLFERNYEKSFTSNDLTTSNPTFSGQAQGLYKITDQWTSQTVVSVSKSKTDGYYSYLWDSGNGNQFGRFINKANGETFTTDIQQNFIGDFKIGSMRNRIVAGLDYFKSKTEDRSSGWAGNGVVSLADGSDTGILTSAMFDLILAATPNADSEAENEIYSAYVSNVLNITPKLSAMASLRVDNFKSKTNATDDEEINGQTALSPKFGLVYQPIENKLSLFANYMNGFKNVAPSKISGPASSVIGINIFKPEHANQYEFGVKTSLLQDKISITASYYNIFVQNKVSADPNNPLNSVQGGEVKSQGIEVSVIANPIEGLNIITGFSNNNSEVTKELTPTDGYLGYRPEEAGPETLINFWASYTLTNTKLKGLNLGVGTNYASEYKTLNRGNGIGSFTLPSYSILNSAISYTISGFNIAVRVNNILNEKYYSGWSTVSPQRLRNITAGLTYKF
jgi:iron complex outermembrane recepter protein